MTIGHLNFITYTQTVLSALIAILAFINFNRRKTYVKFIGLTFLLGFVANAVSLTMFYQGLGRYGNIPQSLYGIFNFGVLCLVYYYALNKRYSTWFALSFVLFALFAVYNFYFVQGAASLSSFTVALSSVLIIMLSIFYFYKLIDELPAIYIHRLPMFWFNTAFLIYSAGTLFLFVFTAYLVNVLKNNMILYWFFHNCLSVMEHFIILVGLWYDLDNRKNRLCVENK